MAKKPLHTPDEIVDIKDQLDMLAGRGKHNTGSNICRGDGIFASSIERTYNMPVSELERLYGPRKRKPKAKVEDKPSPGAAVIDRIEIHEFVSGKPNGDRATHMTACSHFKVFVFNAKRPEPFMAFDYNCFDSFHCHVENRTKGLNAATGYAENLATAIGFGGEVKLRKFQEKIVSHTEWQEVA